MEIYNGGSNKDELLIFVAGNSAPSPVTSLGNQMFITFTTDGNGASKGFTAKITFGIRNNLSIIIYYVYYFAMEHFLSI